MRTITIQTGYVLCDFARNGDLAVKNFLHGRPLFEGQIPPRIVEGKPIVLKVQE